VWTGHIYRGKDWEEIREEERKKNETGRKND